MRDNSGYEVPTEADLEGRERSATQSISESLNNLPKENIPRWAIGGTDEGDRVIFHSVLDYRGPRENDYDDFQKHIRLLETTARKYGLELKTGGSLTDYASFLQSGQEVVRIDYSAYSHTPYHIIAKKRTLSKHILNDVMQDFKKPQKSFLEKFL